MRNAEVVKTLAPEQYGSHKSHRAMALATNKSLTYNLMRQEATQHKGVVCLNDAKSCYDLFGHAQASLAMQRMGIPQALVDCMFTTLQEAAHWVRTGYGDSTTSNGGKVWLIPIHGIGQGNGVGPAIWAVVSTPLLNILRVKGFELEYATPISGLCIRYAGFAFVDDTDLLQMMSYGSTAEGARYKIQAAIDCWGGTLLAMSGAIVPEKTFWHLIDYQWHLGSCGSMEGGYNKPRVLAQEWVEKMKQGKLNRAELWVALQSTIW